MVPPCFLPVPRLPLGYHHGGVRGAAAAEWLARWTCHPSESLRSGTRLPRERPTAGAGYMFRVAEPSPCRPPAARKSW